MIVHSDFQRIESPNSLTELPGHLRVSMSIGRQHDHILPFIIDDLKDVFRSKAAIEHALQQANTGEYRRIQSETVRNRLKKQVKYPRNNN